MGGETAEISGPIAYAWTQYRAYVAIEAAGIFWLAAETAILFFVIAARRHLALQAPLALRALGVRAAVFGGSVMLLPVCLVFRHILLTPLPRALAQGGVSAEAAYALASQRANEHLLVWSAFILGWVVLEVLIVYQGWRVLAALRARLDASGGKP